MQDKRQQDLKAAAEAAQRARETQEADFKRREQQLADAHNAALAAAEEATGAKVCAPCRN